MPRFGSGMAFAGAEGIDGQDEEAELDQAQATRLHDGVAPGPGPVAVYHQHSRHLAADLLGDVGAGRHPDVGSGLEDELLDAVAVALEDTGLTGVERTGLVGKGAHGGEHGLAELGPALFPGLEVGGRLVARAELARFLAMEAVEGTGIGLQRFLFGHDVSPRSGSRWF